MEAPKAVGRLNLTLNHLQSITRVIIQYRNDFESSVEGGVEAEVASVFAIHLRGCQTELQSLQAYVAQSRTILTGHTRVKKLGKRIKWVADERKISDSLERIEEHKSSLQLLLSVIDGRHGLQIRNEIDHVQESLSDAAQNAQTINGEVIQNLDVLKDTMNCHYKQYTQRTLDTRESMEISNQQCIGLLRAGLDGQERSGQRLQELISTTTIANSQQLNHLQRISDSVEVAHAGFSAQIRGLSEQIFQFTMNERSFRATTSIVASTSEMFVRTFCQQIRSVLPQVTEELVSQASAEVRGWLRQELSHLPNTLEQVAREATKEFAPDFNNRDVWSSEFPEDFEDRSTFPNSTFKDNLSSLSKCDCDKTTKGGTPRIASKNPIRWYKRSWTFHWICGTLRIGLGGSVSTMDTDCLDSSQKTLTTEFDFQPSPILFRRGLTLNYTHKTDSRGYAQISPTIRTFATVETLAGIENTTGMLRVEWWENAKAAFRERRAAPTDRDEQGLTYLFVAAVAGHVEAFHFLLSQGAEPLACDAFGCTVIDILYMHLTDYPPRLARNSMPILQLLHDTGHDSDDGLLSKVPGINTHLAMVNDDLENIYPDTELWAIWADATHFLESVWFTNVQNLGNPFTWTSDLYFGLNVTRLALAAGISPNRRNNLGQNSLHTLNMGGVYFLDNEVSKAQHDYPNLVVLLIEAGADIYAVDSLGVTPTHIIAINDTAKMIDDRRPWSPSMEDWFNALKACGIDLKDVLTKLISGVAADSSSVDFQRHTTNGRARLRKVRDRDEDFD
ncbi:MAG: hypothetical protein M1827_004086 [Pycnora praestabilis]|nr:MAG: hypothetical protein M1827_004086 [Pycnora praestabilis]